MSDLRSLGPDIGWPDDGAMAAARTWHTAGDVGGGSTGRLGELAEWLAGAQGHSPPHDPARARCVIFGPASARADAIARQVGVGIRRVDAETIANGPVGAHADDQDPDPAEHVAATADASEEDEENHRKAAVAAAIAFGMALADDEIDSGADLLLVADPDADPAAAVLVAVLTGAEPVALLPRGAAATDTAAWIARLVYVRDTRRRVVGMRAYPDELLAVIGHPLLAASAGFIARTVARRTPLILDGAAAAAAAVLVQDIWPQAGNWWRVADCSPDPVHTHAVTHLDQRPVLDLDATSGDGCAGLLTVALVRAAARLGPGPQETTEGEL